VTRILILFATCSLFLVSGLTQGLWTGRWVVSHGLEDAVTRLDEMPLTVGDWKGTLRDIPAEEIGGARVNGYRACRFENRRKGLVLDVLLVCGRPGVVSVHTPDICYRGAGYEITTGPDAFAPGGDGLKDAGLQTATFRKEGVVAQNLRIFWTWNAAGRWQAPSNPRWTFARSAALYKLYVVRSTGGKDAGRPEQDPAVDFMRLYLPELNRALFPASATEQ
jgi:hypothetical protein